MATKYLTAFFASMLPAAAAFGQSNAPPMCYLGMPCVVDAKGIFVGVGGVQGQVIHVFNGIDYVISINGLPSSVDGNGGVTGGLNAGFTLFFYTSGDCSGTPYLMDVSPIPLAQPNSDGTLYAAARPLENIQTQSVSNGLSGPCGARSGTILGDQAYMVDSTVAKSWVAPFDTAH